MLMMYINIYQFYTSTYKYKFICIEKGKNSMEERALNYIIYSLTDFFR